MEKIRCILLLSIVFVATNFYVISNNTYDQYLTLVMAQLEPISIIQKFSEKGYYLVQFKSGLGPITPEIPIDIVFLNATYPTTGREGTVFSSPEAIEGGDTELAQSNLSIPFEYNIAPVQSYDLTIYDDQGNTLWQKVNNNLVGISGKNFVTLGNYIGNITISLDNIRMPSSDEKTLKDSVKFNVFVDSNNVLKADPSKIESTIHPTRQ
jgi:hypothetical protein